MSVEIDDQQRLEKARLWLIGVMQDCEHRPHGLIIVGDGSNQPQTYFIREKRLRRLGEILDKVKKGS